MSNLSDERLSSLLDGELDGVQRRQVIDELGQDAASREQWSRFNLASDALHGNLPDAIDLQFSARVMAAIDDEPAILAPTSTTTRIDTTSPTATPASITRIPSSFSKRFAGLAVAASVAAVAVLGVESMYQQDPTAPRGQQVATASAPAAATARLAEQSRAASLAAAGQPQPTTVSARSGVLVAQQAEARRIDPRLHKYLINHSQQAARANVQGVMPYARIVTYAGMHRQPVQR